MTREWVALRSDKDGNPRGFWKCPPQRRIRATIDCPGDGILLFNLDTKHLMIYEYLDKSELITAMCDDEKMRSKPIDTTKRKVALIIQWVRDGNTYSSQLLNTRCQRMSRRQDATSR